MVEDHRHLTRQPAFLHGVVYFNDGHGSLPCNIRDVSYEGARIVISDPIEIPDEIELYIPDKHQITHASVRWRHGNKIGLAFSEVRHTVGKDPRNLHRDRL